MTDSVDIEMNFREDWIDILKDRLVSMGYKYNHGDGPIEIGIKYFNALKRQIEPKIRNENTSKEFNCPPEHEKAIENIRRLNTSGGNLNPYLSKRLLDLEFNDPLLNDWGIHHFHLGTELDQSGFIKRTGPLLFARLTSGDMYFIDVLEHGNWSNSNLVTIIHENWPSTIERYRLKDVISMRSIPTDGDIAKLRKAGISSFIHLGEGAVYGPFGGGYTSSGRSVQAVLQHNQYMKHIEKIENHVREHLGEFVQAASDRGHDIKPPFHFKLEVNEGSAFAFEINNRIAFKVADI